jgi:hypothetical protein
MHLLLLCCQVLDFTDRYHELDRGSELVSCKDVFGGAVGGAVALHGYTASDYREFTLRRVLAGLWT